MSEFEMVSESELQSIEGGWVGFLILGVLVGAAVGYAIGKAT